MESSVSSGMCRCCASEGTFKDINAKYYWMGEEEIYSEMLNDCFNISLNESSQNGDSGICEVCITQLRNSVNFKKQVLNTEDQFKNHLESKMFKECEIKVEYTQEDSTMESESNGSDEDYSAIEFVVPLKKEEEDSKPKKRSSSSKPSTSRGKKPKKERVNKSTSKSHAGATKNHRKKNISEEGDVDVSLNQLSIRVKHIPEMKKQWHNLTTLLKYSNATPFKERNDAGYVCAYCFKTFPEPDVLRRHTNDDHVGEKPTYKAASSMANFVVFLDVLHLKCTLCDQLVQSLRSLAEHLTEDHKKMYYMDIMDYFQPFIMTSEQQMKCYLCDEVYHNMKLLMQHMNVHYRNYICPICGAGFVNSFRLNRHEATHAKKKSNFPCRYCGEIFTVESKRKAHVNTQHKGIAGDSVCQICKARFKNYYQKTRHMIQVHNMEGIKCDLCSRKFNLKSNLTLHKRSVHLKERPYECSVCSMGFFIKKHMIGHYLATHTNERKYKCDVCGRAYATQNSKRKHMRKNHGITKNSTIPQSQNTPK